MLCRFALAFTLYFPMMNVMAYYCHDYPTFRSFWFATVNSNNMWYCFLKAWFNVLLGKITRKESGFKVQPLLVGVVTDWGERRGELG